MQLIKKQELIGNIAFHIGIAIHLLVMSVGFSIWNIPFQGRLLQVAFGLFCIKILTTFYSRNEWIAMVLLGMLGTISYIGTRDEYVVGVIVMIFAAKNVDMKRICKWILVVAAIFTIAIIGLSLVGIGGEMVDIRHYGRGMEETRWCLGFGHANNLHGTAWYLISLLVYLYFEKLNWKHYLILTIGNILLYMLTVSRSGIIATQIVIIAAFLLQYCKPLANKLWVYLTGVFGVAGVIIVSISSVCIDTYTSAILTFLNQCFTGRILLAYQHANISMWKWISCAGEFGDAVDNGWVTIFFNYGYVIGIAFVLFQLYLIYRTWQEKDGILLTLIVTCAFYTFMEATYTMNSAYLLCNVSYIVAMILLSRRKNEVLKGRVDESI